MRDLTTRIGDLTMRTPVMLASGTAGYGPEYEDLVDLAAVGAVVTKTITVETSYLKLHPRYKKFVKRHSKFKAHDEDGKAKEGDLVEIAQTRPMSKTKRYRLVRIVRSARG